jgi:hypothetical protein
MDYLKTNIVDFILDKISKLGIENLSKQDKEVLDGIYKDKNINISQIENFIFNSICNGESKQNIIDDAEEEFDVHSYYILPIYDYCEVVFKRIESLFKSLDRKPSLSDFFQAYSSYNTASYISLFNNKSLSIGKAYKESFESVEIYFDDDEYFDLKDKIVDCFKIIN